MPHSAPQTSWKQVKPVVDKFTAYLDHCKHVVKNEFCLWQQCCSAMQWEMPGPLSAVCAMNMCPRSVYLNVHVAYCCRYLWCHLCPLQSQKECFLKWTWHWLTAAVLCVKTGLRLSCWGRQRVIDLSADDITKKFAMSWSRWLGDRSFYFRCRSSVMHQLMSVLWFMVLMIPMYVSQMETNQ